MSAPARHLAVRYTVKADRLEEHLGLLAAVFEQLSRAQPPGLRYEAFRVDGEGAFLHLASVQTPDGSNPLLTLEAFQRFTAGMGERCVAPPLTEVLERRGAFPPP